MTVIEDSAAAREWIGPKPTAIQITAIMTIGTIGMLICGVQPVLLGALVTEGRLSNAGLGQATTAEFVTLGLFIAFAGTFLKPRRLPLIAIGAALVTGLADIGMLYQSGAALLLNRAISGAGEAILVWVGICMITRSSTPTRWAAIFLTLQGITQLAFAALIPLTLMASHGANGGFVGMAGSAVLAAMAAPFLPRQMVDLPKGNEESPAGILFAPRSLLVLLSVFLISAFSIGLFSYLAPLAIQAGLSQAQLGFIVSMVLGTSVLGAAAAALFPDLPYFPIFAANVVINGIILYMLWALPGFPLFMAAAALFGLSWQSFQPYQLPMAIEADPTRRVATMMGGVQLIGASAGPLVCSFFVTDSEARGSLIVVGICFAAAFLFACILHFGRRRHAAATTAGDLPRDVIQSA
jgi:hypothetical protein